MSTPEATAPEATHVYSPQELSTRAGIDRVKADFGSVDRTDPAEISNAVLQMEEAGVLVRDTSDNPKPDDVFGGLKVTVNGGNSELTAFLGDLRTNAVLGEANKFYERMSDAWANAPLTGQSIGLGVALAAAEAYRTGEIDLATRTVNQGRTRKNVVYTQTNSPNVMATAKGAKLEDITGQLDSSEKAIYQNYLDQAMPALKLERHARDAAVKQELKTEAAATKERHEAEAQAAADRADMLNHAEHYNKGRDLLKEKSPATFAAYEKRLAAATDINERNAINNEFDEVAGTFLNDAIDNDKALAQANQIDMLERARLAVLDAHKEAQDAAQAVKDTAGSEQQLVDMTAAKSVLPSGPVARQKKMDSLHTQALKMDAVISQAKSDEVYDEAQAENKRLTVEATKVAAEHTKNMLDPDFAAQYNLKDRLTGEYQARIDATASERTKAELIVLRDKEITDELAKLEAAREKPKTQAELAADAAAQAKKAVEDAAALAALTKLEAANGGPMPDKDTDPAAFQARIDAARKEAMEGTRRNPGDGFAKEQSALYERFQKQIDALPLGTDPSVKAKMVEDRDQAVKLLKSQQIEVQTDGLTTARDVREKLAKGEQSIVRLAASDAKAEAKAIARHKQLGLDKTPFLERKAGGRLHWSKSRRQGAKVLESFFRDPSNPNLVVVERRLRRNGDLVSQTILTTERGIRDRGNGVFLPPKEVFQTLEDIRTTDTQTYKSAGRVAKVDQAFDGGGGVYAKYGADVTDLGQHRDKGAVKRRGGILNWWFGR